MVKENKLPVVLQSFNELGQHGPGCKIVHVVEKERVFDSYHGASWLVISFLSFVCSGLMFALILKNNTTDKFAIILLSVIGFLFFAFACWVITWTFEDQDVVKHHFIY